MEPSTLIQHTWVTSPTGSKTRLRDDTFKRPGILILERPLMRYLTTA